MKMFIKLFVLSVLFSSCLAVSLPKSILLKLCKTAISVGNLGLNDDEFILAMNYIGNNYLNQLDLPANFKQMPNQNCNFQLAMTNSGGLQIMLVPLRPMMGSGMNTGLLKEPQSNISAFEPTSNSSVSDSVSKVVSSLTSDYCENVDLPESVEIENQVDVQKAVLRIISSLLST
uniref:Uncharacterized protein n=1 Tax=Tetranychus urticae TaxID=32264 RepID=T1KZP6_TETUR